MFAHLDGWRWIFVDMLGRDQGPGRDNITSQVDLLAAVMEFVKDSLSGYLDAIDLSPRFTRATLAVLDTVGHGLAWERPAVLNALFLDWLDRVGRRFLTPKHRPPSSVKENP